MELAGTIFFFVSVSTKTKTANILKLNMAGLEVKEMYLIFAFFCPVDYLIQKTNFVSDSSGLHSYLPKVICQHLHTGKYPPWNPMGFKIRLWVISEIYSIVFLLIMPLWQLDYDEAECKWSFHTCPVLCNVLELKYCDWTPKFYHRTSWEVYQRMTQKG